MVRQFDEFTRIQGRDAPGRAGTVDLGVDYRADPPVALAPVGPVLSRR